MKTRVLSAKLHIRTPYKPRLPDFSPLCISTHQTTDNTRKTNQPFIHKRKVSERSSRDKNIENVLCQLIFDSIRSPEINTARRGGGTLHPFSFPQQSFQWSKISHLNQVFLEYTFPQRYYTKVPLAIIEKQVFEYD